MLEREVLDVAPAGWCSYFRTVSLVTKMRPRMVTAPANFRMMLELCSILMKRLKTVMTTQFKVTRKIKS